MRYDLPNDTRYNEKELIELIAKGDEFAFAKLVNNYKNKIYSIAFKLTKSSVIAEEIVQDVFLKIWLKRATLTGIQNFDAYIFIVTRNNVYKVLKEIAQNYSVTFLTDEHQLLTNMDASDLVAEKEYNLLLQKAVERLPNQQKQVYNLTKNEGFKRNEVANQLDLQPDTVKFHLAQAMKKIRAFCLLHLSTYSGIIICSSLFL
ncbi:MAG: sigma-70 family RNA polymerase sigma factor [Ginsengibacter sp.]